MDTRYLGVERAYVSGKRKNVGKTEWGTEENTLMICPTLPGQPREQRDAAKGCLQPAQSYRPDLVPTPSPWAPGCSPC